MSTLCVSTPEIDFNILCWFLVYCSSFRALLYRRPPLEAIWLSGVLLHVVLVHSQTFHEVCDSLINIFDCVSIDTFFFPGSIGTPFLVRCSKHVIAFTTLLAHAISSSVSRRKLFQYPWNFFFSTLNGACAVSSLIFHSDSGTNTWYHTLCTGLHRDCVVGACLHLFLI